VAGKSARDSRGYFAELFKYCQSRKASVECAVVKDRLICLREVADGQMEQKSMEDAVEWVLW
jgi:dTDP-4-dehydrorhamnose 3,5-epimerase-like enzyme